jgi:Rrf2 family protein
MLMLPRTAEYALRAVCWIAEREAAGPVPVSAVAEQLGAPQNYLSKTLHQLGAHGVLHAVRGAQGGYRLGRPAEELRLADIVGPFLPPMDHQCIMGRARCGDDVACGAHWRWKAVKETTRAFFADVTLADLLANPSAAGGGARMPLPAAAPESR